MYLDHRRPDPAAAAAAAAWLVATIGRDVTLDMAEHELELVSSALHRATVTAGTCLMRAGSGARQVVVVRRGAVELRRPNDPRGTVISTVGEGAVFGDVPAILGTSNELDAYAVTDVDLMWIAARDLPDLLARVPGLARKWVTSLSERLLETHQRLYEVLAGHLDLRIAAVLLRRAGAGGHVDITQAKLARLLGVQRSSVNRAVRRLEARGLVRRCYGCIQVVDAPRLGHLVADPGH